MIRDIDKCNDEEGEWAIRAEFPLQLGGVMVRWTIQNMSMKLHGSIHAGDIVVTGEAGTD